MCVPIPYHHHHQSWTVVRSHDAYMAYTATVSCMATNILHDTLFTENVSTPKETETDASEAHSAGRNGIRSWACSGRGVS